MKTFEEFLSDAAQRGGVNLLFESGMYSLLDDLERLVKTLRRAGSPFEVVGGVAVNAHLLDARQRSRTFVTRDIDVLIHRSEIDKISRTAEADGYQAKRIVGGYMLIRPSQQPAEAVHFVFAGEKSRAIEPFPHPEVSGEEKEIFGISVPVAPLADLVRMKLNSYRPRDLVHLQALDECGLIPPQIERGLPDVLRERLAMARRQFAEDQPDELA